MNNISNKSPLTADLAAALNAWNHHLQTFAQTDLPASVPALVRQQAALHGDRVLINLFEDDQQLTYAQFDDLSTLLAVGLARSGLRAGDRAAVMLPNCIQYHLTWLALAKLGAVIVPVNPAYTARELNYVFGDSQATAWVFHADAADAVQAVAQGMSSLNASLCIAVQGGLTGDSAWHQLISNAANESAEQVPSAVASKRCEPNNDTLLNIQYTSGTTGFPKGCMLTHGYWLTLAHSALSVHVQPHQRFFTAQPFFYMDPFWQLLQAVWCGGTLIAAKKLSASRFFGWLEQHQIEWAQLPELALKSIDTVQPKELALRQVFTFGWSVSARSEFTQSFGVVANESFGMTEIGLGLAMPPSWPASDRATSVGLASLHRQARLMVTERLEQRPARPGETGELWIKGRHIFQGYWNKPEVNAQVIQDGWFKTGDAFVCDDHGFYRIVGRFKEMIRRSGENIAAREVEEVVRMLPQVLDCAAVAVADGQRGEEVKIWIQLKPRHVSHGLKPGVVIAHCQANLAPFKVPRYIAFIGDLPRTASNKVAKTQLPATGLKGSFDRATGNWV